MPTWKGFNGWISYNNRWDLDDKLFPRLLSLVDSFKNYSSLSIVLELSESTLQVFRFCSCFRSGRNFEAKGALLALDDFGVLSSNFLSLSKLSVDMVKLDKFLTTDVLDNPKNQSIVKVFDLSAIGFLLLKALKTCLLRSTRCNLPWDITMEAMSPISLSIVVVDSYSPICTPVKPNDILILLA